MFCNNSFFIHQPYRSKLVPSETDLNFFQKPGFSTFLPNVAK